MRDRTHSEPWAVDSGLCPPPFGWSTIALHGSVAAFAQALLDEHVPPLSLEQVAALSFLHAADRWPDPPPVLQRPPHARVRDAARVVVVLAPLLQLTEVGWLDAATPAHLAWQDVVVAFARWTKTPTPPEVFALGTRVGRETPAIRTWDALRWCAEVFEVAGLLRAIRPLQREAVRQRLLEPCDQRGVLTELLTGGPAAGPRTTRGVVRGYDADGVPVLDGRAVLRRIRRRNEYGAPAKGARAPARQAENLDRGGCPAPRMRQETRRPKLPPELPPEVPIEIAAAERLGDADLDAAHLMTRAAKTRRERDLLTTLAWDDTITTIAEAADTVGMATATAYVHLHRVRTRIRGG
jgi:hypothetical protein